MAANAVSEIFLSLTADLVDTQGLLKVLEGQTQRYLLTLNDILWLLDTCQQLHQALTVIYSSKCKAMTRLLVCFEPEPSWSACL